MQTYEMYRTEKDAEVVRKYLDFPELLTQLAEEAAELSQAALKLRRAVTGTNPTPVPVGQAYDELIDELADVAVCMKALRIDGPIERSRIDGIGVVKMSRWATRLTEKEARA